MSVVKSLAGWIERQVRTVGGGVETSLRARFIALIALLSLIVIVVSAVKLIRSLHRVEVLTLATARERGEYSEFGKTLANVVNHSQSRILIRMINSPGSHENMQWLAASRPDRKPRRIDLAVVQKDTPSSPPIRAIASLFPEAFHLIAAKSANIDGVEDLRGRRVAVMPNLLDGPGTSDCFFDGFIERYGMTRRHLKAVMELDLSHAGEAFDAGDIDAIFLAIAVGNKQVQEILTSSPVELVPIDVHAIETWHPYAQKATIYKGAYRGYPPVPPEDVDTAAVEALLLTHEDVDEGVIHEVTRILFEHRNELLKENPHAFTIQYPDAGANLGIPLHRGAKAFYDRDKPGFLVLYAEPIALLFSIAVLCVTGLWQLRLRYKERQKNRADSYNLEILALVERIRAIEDFETLEALRQQLFDIFRRVLEDLDQDRLSPESFQLFTFPCEVAIAAMRHREMILMNLLPRPQTSNGRTGGEPIRAESCDAAQDAITEPS